MKAIILAAGKGSRISYEIGDMPKSILPLKDGTPIIRRSVVQMLECGIKPVVCTGYKREMIREALKGLDVTYYDNPFYEITNNIASLWFALPEFGNEDMLLTSADLYYPKEFLNLLKNSNENISLIVDSSRIDSGDFYISIDKNGFINEYGPNVDFDKRKYEYMGFIKISSRQTNTIKKLICQYLDQGDYGKYFEDMFFMLSMNEHIPVEFIDVAGYFWREFDYYRDYQVILEHENQACKSC